MIKMESKEQLCIIKINENIRAVENDQPLTLSLSELKHDCRFMKFYNDFYNQKKRVENSIRKKICKCCGNSFEINTMMYEWARSFCSDKCRNKCMVVGRKRWLKEYYQKNKAEIKAKRKEYNQRPEVKAKQKEYKKEYNQRPEVKAKQKEYSQRPEVKAKRKEYSQKNKAELKAKRKEYYQKNKAEIKAKRKEYYEKTTKNN